MCASAWRSSWVAHGTRHSVVLFCMIMLYIRTHVRIIYWCTVQQYRTEYVRMLVVKHARRLQQFNTATSCLPYCTTKVPTVTEPILFEQSSYFISFCSLIKCTRYSTGLHCTSISRAYWPCFDRDGVCHKLPPTRCKPQQLQTTEICACHEQPTPYRHPIITKHPIEKTQRKQTGKTSIQRMST